MYIIGHLVTLRGYEKLTYAWGRSEYYRNSLLWKVQHDRL